MKKIRSKKRITTQREADRAVEELLNSLTTGATAGSCLLLGRIISPDNDFFEYFMKRLMKRAKKRKIELGLSGKQI